MKGKQDPRYNAGVVGDPTTSKTVHSGRGWNSYPRFMKLQQSAKWDAVYLGLMRLWKTVRRSISQLWSNSKFENPWLVQLATGAKRRVIAKIKDCSFTIAGQPVTADLNVLPLGSYDILIGMDWLEKHWSLVDYKTKIIYFRDHLGNRKEMQGIKRPVQVRPITASQLVKCIRKGCQVYAIQVGYADSKNKTAILNNIPVIQEFTDVFPEEIPGLPPRRNIDFTIELVPGAAPVSWAPYRMSVPELTELKM
eukprot:PITA_20887